MDGTYCCQDLERHFDGSSQREIFQRHYAKCIKEETLVHCTSLLLKTLPANTHTYTAAIAAAYSIAAGTVKAVACV